MKCWQPLYITLSMRTCDVHDIAAHGFYEDVPLHGQVHETHISWVILTRHFAFKIKKPVRLDFLNFSTAALRKRFCDKELQLNRRFSEIYMTVLPVRRTAGIWHIGGPDDSDIVDYCVVMRRMAVSKRMDNRLIKGDVRDSEMVSLARTIAQFHHAATPIFTPFDVEQTRSVFNDILSVQNFIHVNMGERFGNIVYQSVRWSNSVLYRYRRRMHQRVEDGMKRDVHGDLHCGNIFLYKTPVLFDCIEFNDDFRQIDVLYEIAFLSMDMERYMKRHLADVLLREYSKHFPAFWDRADLQIFNYFKALRANIRAKVHVVQWQQISGQDHKAADSIAVARYLALLQQYVGAG